MLDRKGNQGWLVAWVLAMPCSMWNLSSLTRGQTCAPAVKAQSPTHWTTRELPGNHVLSREAGHKLGRKNRF